MKRYQGLGFLGRLKGLRVIVENKKILIGLCMTIGWYLFATIGSYVSPYRPRTIGDVPINLPPSWEHPLGSDPLGRDIFTQLLYASVTSMQIGFTAGIVAFTVATLLGLIAGCHGGILDGIINMVTEVFITIPSLAILLIVAAVIGRIEILTMALLLAVFGWAFPCKVLRSQALVLRERGFIKLAKLSGANGLEIAIKSILPNMLPFLGSWFAFVVIGAIEAETGLELIGLGPQTIVSLGLMLNWAMRYTAFTRGLVHWWLPPALVLMWIFVGLFIVSFGLDEIGNPKLKVK
jgi:peptide/nickel transport system permease protein